MRILSERIHIQLLLQHSMCLTNTWLQIQNIMYR